MDPLLFGVPARSWRILDGRVYTFVLCLDVGQHLGLAAGRLDLILIYTLSQTE